MNEPIKVSFDKNFKDTVSKCYPKLDFPDLCDTTPLTGEPVHAWGLELPENPNTDYLKYAVALANGSINQGAVIQVIGGASGFNTDLISTPEAIEKTLEFYPNDMWVRSVIEIFQAAHTSQATIITGGTQSGIMALVSTLHIVSRGIFNQISQPLNKYCHFFPQSVSLKDSLAPPKLIHVVPAELTVFPNNNYQIAWDKKPSILAPCTGFLVVPGIDSWGNDNPSLEETQWWNSYIPTVERVLGLYCKNGKDVSRVVVLFNGGFLTLAEAYSALFNHARIVLVEHSGRLADVLCKLLRNNWDINTISRDDIDTPALSSNIGKDEYYQLLKRFCLLAAKKRSVFLSELGSIGMDSLISLLLAGVKPEFLNKTKPENSNNPLKLTTTCRTNSFLI